MKNNSYTCKTFLIIFHGLFLPFLFIILSNIQASAMIHELTLEQLVQSSDAIAIVDTLAVKAVGTLPSGFGVVANLVKVYQPLMGSLAVGETFKVKTWLAEDNAEMVKGGRYLLFLKKEKDYFVVTAGIMGAWPINKKEEFLGYGIGRKISDVEAVIEKEINAEKKPVPEKAKMERKAVISL